MRFFCALVLVVQGSSAIIERWVDLGRGEALGQVFTYGYDDTWPNGHGIIRTAHWRVVYDSAGPDGVRERRFIERVDCERELRMIEAEDSYDDAGHLVRSAAIPVPQRRWLTTTNNDIPSEAVGFACIDPVGRK